MVLTSNSELRRQNQFLIKIRQSVLEEKLVQKEQFDEFSCETEMYHMSFMFVNNLKIIKWSKMICTG